MSHFDKFLGHFGPQKLAFWGPNGPPFGVALGLDPKGPGFRGLMGLHPSVLEGFGVWGGQGAGLC